MCTGEAEHFPIIIELLKDEQAHCYNIGTWLKLRPSTLELIRAESPDHATAMVEIILNWLRGSYNTEMFGPPTWKMLAEAVRAGGNNRALAEKIVKIQRADAEVATSRSKIECLFMCSEIEIVAICTR